MSDSSATVFTRGETFGGDMTAEQEMRTRAAQESALVQLYESREIVRFYECKELKVAEALLLLKYHADFRGRKVLDIGIGGGRTTRYLSRMTASYVGLERSVAMLECARARHPSACLVEGDMRDLSRFADGEFDTVFIPWNTIDAVSHQDRRKVLSEAFRVLRPGGLFIFSSENRACRNAGAPPKLQLYRNPVSLLASTVRYCVAQYNFRRMKPLEIRTEEYAILNDNGHGFKVLHYFIDPEHQVRQLTDVGFEFVECTDENGGELGDGRDSSHAGTVHYVARKR